MASVDPLYAQWLQAPSSYAVRGDAAMSARWGATAIASERITGIATLAAAQVEADRQLAFFSRGPFAVDVHTLVGTDWSREIGRVVTLMVDQLDYEAGVDVFVLEVDVNRGAGTSEVAVLRPLRKL